MNQLGNIIDTNYDFERLPDNIHLAGVSFEGRQDVIPNLFDGTDVKLVRDPKNAYDKNAIKVFTVCDKEEVQIGWIPKNIAQVIAAEMDAGIDWAGKINKIIGGETQTKGVLINLYIPKDRRKK